MTNSDMSNAMTTTDNSMTLEKPTHHSMATDTTCHHLSPYELFLFSLSKVINQGSVALDSDGRCNYLGASGLRCAVGHCIPAPDYKTDFEGIGALSASIEYDEFRDTSNALYRSKSIGFYLANRFTKRQVSVLAFAQHIHDTKDLHIIKAAYDGASEMHALDLEAHALVSPHRSITSQFHEGVFRPIKEVLAQKVPAFTVGLAMQLIDLQGSYSIEPESRACRYRGTNGIKCAAGWFIENADYCSDLEGDVLGWCEAEDPHLSYHYKTFSQYFSGISAKNLRALRIAQIIHDRFSGINSGISVSELVDFVRNHADMINTACNSVTEDLQSIRDALRDFLTQKQLSLVNKF